jgi:hypothetical protein
MGISHYPYSNTVNGLGDVTTRYRWGPQKWIRPTAKLGHNVSLDHPTYPIVISYTLWLFNIAMENGPFIDDSPIKTSI